MKIPLIIGIDAIHGNGMVAGTTVYPSPISLASTFDEKIAYQIGKETAIEVRAHGSHWSFTPNIDVLRDPRWGRVGETFGEDPYLVGNFGVEMIKGLQSDDLGFGQTGIILGEMLEMSTATLAMSTEVAEGKIRVKRELESGYFQWITMTLPASISVQSGCNTPRYPSLKGIMGGKKKEITEVQFDEIDTFQSVKRLYSPSNSKETVMIEGSTENIVEKLVDVLKNEIKIA